MTLLTAYKTLGVGETRDIRSRATTRRVLLALAFETVPQPFLGPFGAVRGFVFGAATNKARVLCSASVPVDVSSASPPCVRVHSGEFVVSFAKLGA